MAGLFPFFRRVYQNGAWFLVSLSYAVKAVFQVVREANEEFCKDQDEAEVETLTISEPVEVGTVSGPQRTYTLLGCLAVGDVADIHITRARSESGSEKESYYLLKMSRSAEGDTRLDNERQTLAHLLFGRASTSTYCKYLPTLVDTFATKDAHQTRVNAFLYEPGFYTLEQVHNQHPALDGRHLAWIFNRLLTVLGFCHRRQIVHGAILPCHVLIHAANHGLQLIGWGQSVTVGGRIDLLTPGYRDWYPAEVSKQQPASPATDLFLAARCLIYLAGGEPVRDRMPDTVPVAMSRFVNSCLLEGVNMCPNDAWALMDEFDDLLSRLYGPPKFHTLTMF